MNDLKEDLLSVGIDEEAIEAFLHLQSADLLKQLKRQRCLQLEKIHEEQQKIDRLDYLIRRKERKKDEERRTETDKRVG